VGWSRETLEEMKMRKGPVRRADVPAAVLEALNAGKLETLTLAEWLAVDQATLLRNVLPEVGLKREAAGILAAYGAARDRDRAEVGARGLGVILHEALTGHAKREAVLEAISSHASDLVRAWATYIYKADARIPLAKRLRIMKRFAADSNMSVRECAWTSIRPYIAAELETGLRLLEPWVRDEDANVRRCAVEATRPRAVWAPHIPEMKARPEQAAVLLEPVKADPSRYVQNAVGNWLNDASKTRPDWVSALCARWERESPSRETQYIVRRALRTLRKASG
jgi:3-methyladenine DNA glycosylase AlkC